MAVRHVLLPPVGGHLSTRMAPLGLLIQNAYGVQSFQISGGPQWMDSAGFDIEAKAEGNPSRDRIWVMLQSLLEDRFKLAVHRETKVMPVYDLSAAKGGIKLAAPDGSCSPGASPPPARKDGQTPGPCGYATVSFDTAFGLAVCGREISMAELARQLSAILQKPVVNKTGYAGKFDVLLPFAYQEDVTVGIGNPWHPTDTSGSVPLADALSQALGLKLERSKGPIEMLVVDHAERPTEN